MSSSRNTYKNLIVVSVGFLFLFTAFQALQNLQSSIHDENKLGFMSLVAIYASLLVSCMFTPPLLIGKLGCKYTLMLSMLGYVLYTVSMFYPKYWTVLPASVLLGFCGAPLWSAKCAYLTTAGIKYAKHNGIPEDNVITNFFGIFFLIFQSGQIWGNLISSFILKPTGHTSNSTNSSNNIGTMCGRNYCPAVEIPDQPNVSRSTVVTLMSIYLGFGCLAIALVFFFLQKITVIGGHEKKRVCGLFIATLKHMKNRKMQLLVPLTIFSGLEQGFVFGDFTKAFVKCMLGIEKVGLVMICFGVVDAVFSLILSKVVKWTGRPLMMGFAAVVNLGLLLGLLLWEPDRGALYVYFLCAALWGFADAVWQTQVNAFYGVLFPTNQEAAFSNYRLWESLGFVIAFAYGDYLCIKVKIYILMVVLVVGVIMYAIVEWLRKKDSNNYSIKTTLQDLTEMDNE